MKPSTQTRSLRELGPSSLCSGSICRLRRRYAVVDLMLSLFGKPIRAGEGEHGIAAAIGVAIYPQDAQDGVELERRAGIARYCAKAAGKTAACYFEAHMEVFAQERNRLWRDIRGALAAGQIVPYYQPIVDLETGALVEFEALARWLHPELGVAPSRPASYPLRRRARSSGN